MIPTRRSTPHDDAMLEPEPTRFHRRRVGEALTWMVREDWVDRLCDLAAGLSLSEWERDGRLEVVKSQPLRTVYRLRTEAGEFYVKRFRTTNWQTVARNLLRGSQAKWEAGRTRLLMERGVPTARLVAWAESSSLPFAYESLLITESLGDSRPLTEALASSSGWPCATRLALVDCLAVLVARLHHSGLLHGDLHTSNILVRPTTDGAWQAWLLDLTKVRVTRPIAAVHRCRFDLALLHHTARIFFATERERQRFFLQYWRARQTLAGEMASIRLGDRRSIWHELVGDCERYSRQLFDGLDRRWASGNHHQVVADRGSVQCRGVSWLGRETIEHWRDRPNSLFMNSWVDASEERHDSPLRRVRVRTVRGEIDAVVTKPPTSARHGWNIAHTLGRRGIPCVQPLMFVEGSVGSAVKSLLVTQRPGAHLPLLAALACGNIPSASSSLDLREAGLRVAALLRKLHDEGFVHMTCSIDDFGVAEGEIPTVWQSLSDSNPLLGASIWRPEMLKQHDRAPREAIRSSLADLIASVLMVCRPLHTDWLRCLKAVLRPAERANWKQWWRELSPNQQPAHAWRRCA